MGKKMVINCCDCDTRKVTEAALADYESITINGALILTNAQSRAILAQHNVVMNCANVMDIEGDVKVRTINGSGEIKSSDAPVGHQYLIVNGSVKIGPDTQSVLEHYIGILVNGTATYPESISGSLGMMTVNGSTCCYPDGAIVLKRNTVIDKTFILRAKNNLYWAAKRLIMVDPELDVAALAAKGATFSAGEVILAESKVEALVGLIDEKADIVIVPDGTAVVRDDVILDETTLRRHGKKLYIIGDLTVNADSAASLEQLEYLSVRGDATVPKEWMSLLLEKAWQITGNVTELKQDNARMITDKVSVKITKWLLEKENDGIHVEDCAFVKIDADVPKDLILERLVINDCARVVCTEDQEDAVTAVCEDVGDIGQAGGDDALGIGNILDKAKDALNTKVVNCASYVM